MPVVLRHILVASPKSTNNILRYLLVHIGWVGVLRVSAQMTLIRSMVPSLEVLARLIYGVPHGTDKRCWYWARGCLSNLLRNTCYKVVDQNVGIAAAVHNGRSTYLHSHLSINMYSVALWCSYNFQTPWVWFFDLWIFNLYLLASLANIFKMS
jgi:hypothetical protein